MSDSEPINILLVDDQPSNLLTYAVILRELGENLLTAHSGREALDLLVKHEIALILLDVHMPESNGFELATMIRQHPRSQQTAMLFISGMSLTDMDLLKGYAHGAVDYLTVPIIPELLRAKVRAFAGFYRRTRVRTPLCRPSAGRPRASRGDCRFVRGRDYQQNHGGDHSELESGGRAPLRLYGCRRHRSADHAPDPAGLGR